MCAASKSANTRLGHRQRDCPPAKAKKAAERAADAWEQEVKAEYQKEKELGNAYRLPPEKRHDDFAAFVNEMWLPLQIRGGDAKPSTVAFYEFMAKPITDYFNGAVLQEISPIEIQKYFTYLRTDYKTRSGKPLSPKSLRHQYVTLNVIFGYAAEQEMLVKNPMEKVTAPKKDKNPVDALTKEQAARLFALLPTLPLDFHCMMNLLVTSGIRRGECIGLNGATLTKRIVQSLFPEMLFTIRAAVLSSALPRQQRVSVQYPLWKTRCGCSKSTESRCKRNTHFFCCTSIQKNCYINIRVIFSCPACGRTV